MEGAVVADEWKRRKEFWNFNKNGLQLIVRRVKSSRNQANLLVAAVVEVVAENYDKNLWN